jgi:hypothetical protein
MTLELCGKLSWKYVKDASTRWIQSVGELQKCHISSVSC